MNIAEETKGGSWSVFRDTYTNSEEKAAYYKKEEEGAQEVLDGRKKGLEELETKISKRTKKIKLNIVHSPKQSYKENKSFRQEFFWAIRG